jgi:hypothetical protein
MPRLKSWESPRRKGRNDKGKGGTARKRQLKKREQMLRNKLKENNGGRKQISSLFYLRDIFRNNRTDLKYYIFTRVVTKADLILRDV